MFRNALILIALILLLVPYTTAQEDQNSLEAKGLKLGIGIDNMSIDVELLKELFDSKVGFHGGIFLTFRLNESFSFQPELLLSTRGTTDGFIGAIDFSTNYIELPLLFKYNFRSNSSLTPSLYLGPSISYLMSSDLYIMFWDKFDVKDAVKDFDFAFAFGGAIDYRRVTFEARYTMGLVDIVDVDGINRITGADPTDIYYFTSSPNVKHNNLSFMFGVTF